MNNHQELPPDIANDIMLKKNKKRRYLIAPGVFNYTDESLAKQHDFIKNATRELNLADNNVLNRNKR